MPFTKRINVTFFRILIGTDFVLENDTYETDYP